MRNSSVLTALFPQVRQGVLAATLSQPDKWWYLSELADHLGHDPIQPSARAIVLGGKRNPGASSRRNKGLL